MNILWLVIVVQVISVVTFSKATSDNKTEIMSPNDTQLETRLQGLEDKVAELSGKQHLNLPGLFF